MIFAVELTPTAETELVKAFEYIHARAPLNAQRWLRGMDAAIASLEHFPHRCALAPEAEYLGEPLRHHLFKSHRIIYIVDDEKQIVRILYIRHQSQRGIGEPENTD